MANFVAFQQFNFNTIDLNFYFDNLDQDNSGFQQDGSFPFHGTTYGDRLFFTATGGGQSRRVEAFGDDVQVTLVSASGTIKAIGETDLTGSGELWYADGISIAASSVYNAAVTGNAAAFLAVIQNALNGNDTITLSPFDDVMNGFGGNDTMKGGAGNDTMDGGSGSDTAVFDASFAASTISFSGGSLTISSAADGTDTLTNFEFVNFNGDIRSVDSLNDAPVPTAATDTATEDGAVVNGQLQATDANGDTLTFTAIAPIVGGITINADGSYSIDPTHPVFQTVGQGETQDFVANFRVSDGNKFASSTLTVTITGANDAPVFSLAGTNIMTSANTAQNFQANATDPDGDPITFSASDPANGTVTGGANGQFTYTPDNGFTGTDTFNVTASDGNGGSTVQAFTATVTAATNSPPQFNPAVLEFATVEDTAANFSVSATDSDGDTLSFSSSDPANGTVTGGANGQFVYTPDSGFTGTDTVTITVIDGNGGSDTQTFVITVNELIENNWGLVASTGFVGQIGGGGNVFGTIGGFQDITVLDLPGLIAFDPSYNQGGDIIRLFGDADTWTVARSGSSARFSDGDTIVQVPLGTVGTTMVFDDGQRVLVVDSGMLKIGDQEFSFDAEQITAGNDGSTLPTGADAGAMPSLMLVAGGVASRGGSFDVLGTRGGFETATLLSGDISFDPSFNAGGDRIVLGVAATDFTAARSGSNVVLDGTDTDLVIPVGLTGMTIEFAGGDSRTLVVDQDAGGIVIGDQLIGFDPIALAAAV